MFVLTAVVLAVAVLVTGRTWNRGQRDYDLLPSTLLAKSLTWALIVVLIVLGVWLLARSMTRRWWRAVVGMLLVAFGALLVARWTTITGWNGILTLPAFWLLFVMSAALCGWLLSAQVTKTWLRSFVAMTLVLATLLLITIGRNARIEEAQDDLRASARPLLASWTASDLALAKDALGRLGTDSTDGTIDGDVSSEDRLVLVEAALLRRMCAQSGEIDSGSGSGLSVEQQCVDLREPALDSQELTRRLGLRCLEGWSVAAVDVWLAEASADRRVVALSSLASCEAGTANPALEQAVDSSEESGDGLVESQPPIETQAPNGEAQAGLPEDVANGDVEAADVAPSAEARAAVEGAFALQRTELRMHEAIARGSDEILRVASGPTDFAEFRFSGAAWLVLLGGVLLWYRQIEIRAGAHRLGPVDVLFDTSTRSDDRSTKDDGADDGERETHTATSVVEAVFKESVIRNVPEPGAIPGSEALAPVGDLVSQSDVPHKTLLSGVIELLQTIFATRGGYAVVFSCRRSDEASAEQSEVVFVRLRSRRTGGQVASKVVAGPNAERAAQEAGYWTAGWIIARSDYVPAWAKWSENDADVFVSLDWSGGPETGLSSPAQAEQPFDLDGPAINSVALAQRAYERQIRLPRRSTPETSQTALIMVDHHRRNHLGALEDFARAVHRQPRYPVARYRRSAVLSTMMHLGGNVWEAAGLDAMPGPADARILRQARLYYLFHDLIACDSFTIAPEDRERIAEGVDELLATEQFPEWFRTMMLRIAAEWSNRNRLAIRWGWAAALRPSERFFWKDFNEGHLGSDWVLLLKSDLCLAAERLIQDADKQAARGASIYKSSRRQAGARRLRRADKRLENMEREVQKRAMQPDSHWQISYNLACLCAIRAQRLLLAAEDLGVTTEQSTPTPHGSEQVAERREAKQEAERFQHEALKWLERCLDRPASDQLVREWVVADGDLKSLHDLDSFGAWRRRVHSIQQAVRDRKPDYRIYRGSSARTATKSVPTSTSA